MQSFLRAILPANRVASAPLPEVRRYSTNLFWRRQSGHIKKGRNFQDIPGTLIENNNDFIRCIPQLSDEDIVRLLQQKRSKIFMKMLPSVTQGVGMQTSLSEDLFSWPHREEIMANVLLGPYLYNVPRSGQDIYLTKEDTYSRYDIQPTLCGELVPSYNLQLYEKLGDEKLGDYGISYSSRQIVVTGSIGKQTFALGDEDKKLFMGKYSIYQYKYPEERDIVAYLRLMREKYEPRSPDDPSNIEWALYHNILAKYVYPSGQQRPQTSRVSRPQTSRISRPQTRMYQKQTLPLIYQQTSRVSRPQTPRLYQQRTLPPVSPQQTPRLYQPRPEPRQQAPLPEPRQPRQQSPLPEPRQQAPLPKPRQKTPPRLYQPRQQAPLPKPRQPRQQTPLPEPRQPRQQTPLPESPQQTPPPEEWHLNDSEARLWRLLNSARFRRGVLRHEVIPNPVGSSSKPVGSSYIYKVPYIT